MPVRKYRRVEDMPDDDKWVPTGHPSIPRRIRFLWRLSSALATIGFPRGVRKYKSIEAANEEREQWEDARIDRIREERGLK